MDITREEANKAVDMANAAERLINNPDYKLVIEEGYFKDELVALGSLLGPHLSEPAEKSIMFAMNGPAAFKAYMRKVFSQGEGAEEALEEIDAE